jgi:5-methylcytosine-specific restriction protein A
MRIEIVFFLIASLVIANIYYDGKIVRYILAKKKYLQMIGILFAIFMMYYLIKKNPLTAQNILTTSNEYIKYLPLDKGTVNMISPILDFSSKTNWVGNSGTYIGGKSIDEHGKHPIIEVQQLRRPINQIHKRSVSETKKKYISAQQGWKCGHCHQQLSATYEVDHKIPLYKGGSNDLTNLISLCANCHRNKTAMDRMKDENGGGGGGGL